VLALLGLFALGLSQCGGSDDIVDAISPPQGELSGELQGEAPAVAAAAGAAVAAPALVDEDPEPVAAAVEADAAPAAEADPTPEPTAVPDPTPAPDPTAEPTPEPEPEEEPEAEAAAPAAVTIADLAVQSPDLSTLASVATVLGLAAPLADADAGPFTVFAPTNNAFEANDALLQTLSEDDARELLGYHVVPGIVNASDLTAGARFETLSGETLVIGSSGGLPGGLNVLTADLEADNGIVHVVDGVLVPAPLILRNLNATIAELEGVQFDVGSANIRADSQAILDQAATVLQLLPEGTEVEVGGHTDSDGDAALNQQLSEARANSVVSYLEGQGVNGDLLTAVGYGEENLLVDPETSDADKQANRRIEFTRPGA